MADQKITQLGENIDPWDIDYVAVAHDPNGSPVTQKVQLGNLQPIGKWIAIQQHYYNF